MEVKVGIATCQRDRGGRFAPCGRGRAISRYPKHAVRLAAGGEVSTVEKPKYLLIRSGLQQAATRAQASLIGFGFAVSFGEQGRSTAAGERGY